MKTARCPFLICAAVVGCFVMTARAQNRDPQNSDTATREVQRLTHDVQINIMNSFTDPAVVGVAANVGPGKISFAIVKNRRIDLTTESEALLKELALDASRLYSPNLRLLPYYKIQVTKDVVLTGPLRVFGVAVGGSTSNDAGCFEGTIGARVVDLRDLAESLERRHGPLDGFGRQLADVAAARPEAHHVLLALEHLDAGATFASSHPGHDAVHGVGPDVDGSQRLAGALSVNIGDGRSHCT